jgi:hypothetical protein
MADTPPPPINPDFLASHQKLSDAQKQAADAVQAIANASLGIVPEVSDQQLWRSFFNICISARMGNTTAQMADFADGCLAEYRTRYPETPPPDPAG